MRNILHDLLSAGGLAVALLGVPVAVHAQVRAMPGSNAGQPVAQTGGAVQNTAQVGTALSLSNPPNVGAYSGSAGYPPPYYGPYSGSYGLGNTLQGASSVINAQGQFNIQNQQAKLAQQGVEQSKVDTRRKQFDEYLYEKANTPTLNELREQAMNEELRRQRNDPPPAEIWSGHALNTLLKAVLKEQSGIGSYGPAIPLSPDVVKQLNLAGGVSGAGLGALKGQQLEWPLALQKDSFAAERTKIEGLSNQLVKQASAGRVDGKTLQQMQTAVTTLKAKVKASIDDMTPSENVKANRFCNELADAARSLEDPAAVNQFNGKWSVKATTVPELIGQMSQQGLTFAPCVAGQEAAYTAAYRALVDYDTALGQMTARLQSPGRTAQQ